MVGSTRSAWSGALALLLAVWLVDAGIAPIGVPGVVADLLMLAVVLAVGIGWHIRGLRAGVPAFGRGTRLVLLALSIGLLIVLVAVVPAAMGVPTGMFPWMFVAVVPLLLGAAAIHQVTEPGPDGPQRLTRVGIWRLAVDAALVTVAIGVLVVLAVRQRPAPDGVEWATEVARQAADAVLAACALVAWSRARPAQQAVLSTLLLAALLLVAGDLVLTLRSGTDYRSVAGASRAAGAAGYWLVAVAALIPLTGPPGPNGGRRLWSDRGARWAQTFVSPLLALLAMAGLAVYGWLADARGLGDGAMVTGVLVLAGLLIVRQALYVAEVFALADRLTSARDRLRWRADHDELTGLLERAAFVRRAADVVAQRRADGAALAVLWVDLDAFERINATFGHATGDAVLRALADRLRAICAADDVLARLGGDEFVVLRPRTDDPLAASAWAERVRVAMAEPVPAEGATLTVACSVGLVESAASDVDLAQLLTDGDRGLYQAKRLGRNRVEKYGSLPGAGSRERTDLAAHLRRVITGGQVLVRYQPVVALDTGRTVGAEALARLPGPDGRELSPAEFLPHLAALGMLTDLAEAVLARACIDFAPEPELGWVSVNLTSEDLANPGLPDRIEALLAGTGLRPDRLLLEINENVVPEPHILRATRKLTALGLRIALDDFGAGWSSLAQLRELNLDVVKIDRSVVVAAGEAGPKQLSAMLVAAVAMAHALDVPVIAEGVESPAQASTVRAAGAEYGQGFLWNSAVDLDVLRAAARRVTRADPGGRAKNGVTVQPVPAVAER